MYVSLPEWCTEVRLALLKKNTNLPKVSKEIGCSYSMVVALISGRIVKGNYLDIAKKINEVLEVQVLPEKPTLPSAEWCAMIRYQLYMHNKMSMDELAEKTGFSRERVSLVANEYSMDEPVIEKINEILNIEVPVVSTGANENYK